MKNNKKYTLRDRLYMFGYRISIRKANNYTLQVMFLDNLSKINNVKCNGEFKHRLALQNRVLKDRMQQNGNIK